MIRWFIEENTIPVPESGCWIWMKGATTGGYGSCRIHGKHYLTHRLSWEVFNGEIPIGLHVLHKCDIPSCCNPSHLFLGTNQDNINDSVNKGRRIGVTRARPSGLKYKWTEKDKAARIRRRKIKDISIIKCLSESGKSQREIAKEIGISQSAVNRYLRLSKC